MVPAKAPPRPGELPHSGGGEQAPTVWSNSVKQIAHIFDEIVKWVRQEPSAAQALILAFLALGVAFQWWHWSGAQTGAVFGIAAVLLGMFVRSQVTPTVRPRDGGRELIAPDAPVTEVDILATGLDEVS
jgi:hypothetical protein